MNAYLPYVVGSICGVFLGALVVVYATKWIAGFKPRYPRALLSTFVAFLAANVFVVVLSSIGFFDSSTNGMRAAIGWGALTCSHITFVRSDSGQSLSGGKAMLLSIVQIFGTIIAAFPILLVFALIFRLFQ